VTLHDETVIEYYENRQIRKTKDGNNCSIFTNNNRSSYFKLYNSKNFKFFINKKLCIKYIL
jgi:hypothetical protein